MITNSQNLINDLVERTQKLISEAESFRDLEAQQINTRAHEKAWSTLECLEHLNLYNEFYIPEFGRSISSAKHPTDELYKSTWFGNYSAESMIPKEKLNKMKTFKDKNPLGSTLDKSAIDRFINFENELLKLLESSRKVSLNKVKCKTTLPLVKFNLGDTLRFVIYHQERHMLQARKALKASLKS